jgi:hypothetical protein
MEFSQKVVSIRNPQLSGEEAIAVAEHELQRARLLVRALEEAIAYFRGESGQAIPEWVEVQQESADSQAAELGMVCGGSVRPLE